MNDNLIQSMATSLEELLRRLTDDRDRIQQQIDRVKGDLAALKSGSPNSLGSNKRTRRPRGANRRAILNLFNTNDAIVLSLAEIVERTQIPSSSVGVVIKKLIKENAIEQTPNGMYSKRQVLTSE